MTPEEMQAKIAELEKENKQLKDNASKQNSYITKLEAKANNSEPAQRVTDPVRNQFDPTVQAYLEKNMKRDVIEEAKAEILKTITDEQYKAIESDFLGFLEKNMKKEHCTVAYVKDAFNLVIGRAFMDKDHAINKLGKDTPTPQSVTPTPITNSSNVQAVQNTIMNTPPVMSNRDINAAPGNPIPEANTVSNTKDAFKNLKNRFSNLGGNRFN